jgi:hypothetical protein
MLLQIRSEEARKEDVRRQPKSGMWHLNVSAKHWEPISATMIQIKKMGKKQRLGSVSGRGLEHLSA